MARRRVLGGLFWIARFVGVILMLLAIFSLPQLQAFAGRWAGSVTLLASIALFLFGIVWLITIELFRHFFDQFLSRN